MKEIILVKNGELALKGLNRSSFEDKLVKNIKHRISDLGDFFMMNFQALKRLRSKLNARIKNSL